MPAMPSTAAVSQVDVLDYTVFVGRGLLPSVAERVHQLLHASQYIIIYDTALASLPVFESLVSGFKAASLPVLTLAVPSGEVCKSRATKASIEDAMLNARCDRGSCVLTLGGGTVSDLGGFISSTYLRGVSVVHVPTSLLGMVDASVGGKTGLDVVAGKNLIGSYHQPKAVFIDVLVLETLPLRHLLNGMAEIIKSAAIRDSKLFSYLEANSEKVKKYDLDVLQYLITAGVRIKADVVCKDEKEGGLRAILNFGHSIGHAIEAQLMPSMLHGEAVAIGMVAEAELAASIGALDTAVISRLTQCIKAYDLPTQMPNLQLNRTMHHLAVDKKNRKGSIQMVVLSAIGSVLESPYTRAFSPEQIRISLSVEACVVPGRASGSIAVPGSKSISNRVLLLAALGKGPTRIQGLLHSEDTAVMITSLRALGVVIDESSDSELVVEGVSGKLGHTSSSLVDRLYFANAGTATRFMTTAVALLPENRSIVLDGNKRMRQRPIGDLVDALVSCGCTIEYECAGSTSLPLRVHGGGLGGGKLELDASVSSQYVSSLLLAAPFATETLTLSLRRTQDVVSRPYIDMTVSLMKLFGIDVERPDPFTFVVPRGCYTSPGVFAIEGDASSASYPLAMAAISGGDVTVTNVGSGSLQGDAQFASVLAKMGCQMEQTTTATRMRPPSDGILRAVDVDLSEVTDTFMTVAAVAAVAKGTTIIRNIANQRVKECDRIEATVVGLKQCGVEARERPDGLEIDGNPLLSDAFGALIGCRGDHRLAMSFAVLGCRLRSIVVDSRRCVGKTYAEFWTHLQTKLHVRLQDPAPLLRTQTHTDTHHSIVLIGMRGVGKSTLGRGSASRLGLNFLDLDEELERREGQSIASIVSGDGWECFRRLEVALLKDVLQTHCEGYLICCGGGIVESPEAVALLQTQPMVVELRRSLQDIDADLASVDDAAQRPSLGFDTATVYARRKNLYAMASNFEFQIGAGDKNWSSHIEQFCVFLSRISGRSPVLLHTFETSFFVSLTYPTLLGIEAELRDVCSVAEAVELRVDLLSNWSELDALREQVATLRSCLPLDTALIFTVRTRAEGGKADFSQADDLKLQLIRLAHRLAVHYIDVESCWSLSERTTAYESAVTKVVGSVHICDKNDERGRDLQALFDLADQQGRSDVVKVVITASSASDAFRVARFAEEWSSAHEGKPVIALAMGEEGKLSRVLNKRMCPVSHPKLPTTAAPGQLSQAEVMQLRHQLGVYTSKRFYIFGKPIQRSPSPSIHNAGFSHRLLPYEYSMFESDNVEELRDVLAQPDFAGASVTIPLKEKLFPLVDSCCEASRSIGAINTICRKHDGSLFGTNTDYLGIQRVLSASILMKSDDSALVVGAGGTGRAAVFALQQLGFKPEHILLYNRTTSRAHSVAKDICCTVVPDLNALPEGVRLRVVVSTVPASVAFTLPLELLCSDPLVLDVNYIPATTALSAQASANGCKVVKGSEMLLEQALAQFELWSSCSAPKHVMRAALLCHQALQDAA